MLLKISNLREQMIIIINLAMKACNVIIWAICKNNKLINKKQKSKIIQYLYQLTGLSDIKEIQQYIIKCDECILILL